MNAWNTTAASIEPVDRPDRVVRPAEVEDLVGRLIRGVPQDVDDDEVAEGEDEEAPDPVSRIRYQTASSKPPPCGRARLDRP